MTDRWPATARLPLSHASPYGARGGGGLLAGSGCRWPCIIHGARLRGAASAPLLILQLSDRRPGLLSYNTALPTERGPAGRAAASRTQDNLRENVRPVSEDLETGCRFLEPSQEARPKEAPGRGVGAPWASALGLRRTLGRREQPSG